MAEEFPYPLPGDRERWTRHFFGIIFKGNQQHGRALRKNLQQVFGIPGLQRGRQGNKCGAVVNRLHPFQKFRHEIEKIAAKHIESTPVVQREIGHGADVGF